MYNGAAHVRESVDSVLRQTYDALEVLVQDNVSSDGSLEVVEALARSDERVVVLKNEEHVDVYSNWNSIISKARGDYVSILSADDCLFPDFVAKCVDSFQEHGVEAVATGFYWNFAQPDGTYAPQLRPSPLNDFDRTLRDFAEQVLEYGESFNINIAMFSRRLVAELSRGGRLFRKGSSSDYELFLRIAHSGMPLRYVSEPLGSYRLHPGGWTADHKLRLHVERVVLLLRMGVPLMKRCPRAYLKRLRLHVRRTRRLALSKAKQSVLRMAGIRRWPGERG